MDKCDVLVTDGFTGNIALKTIEGVAKAFGMALKESFCLIIVENLALF